MGIFLESRGKKHGAKHPIRSRRRSLEFITLLYANNYILPSDYILYTDLKNSFLDKRRPADRSQGEGPSQS